MVLAKRSDNPTELLITLDNLLGNCTTVLTLVFSYPGTKEY